MELGWIMVSVYEIDMLCFLKFGSNFLRCGAQVDLFCLENTNVSWLDSVVKKNRETKTQKFKNPKIVV